ncbi:hypothetical protein ANO11243_022270 [Dothideomycetidae sp. 11243]|nr:hypothetical protein ANO11243_022270 [fungal sp. No.11243]
MRAKTGTSDDQTPKQLADVTPQNGTIDSVTRQPATMSTITIDHALLARQTLSGLEDRLQRLRLVIYGDVQPDDHANVAKSQSVTGRLKAIDKALGVFESQTSSVQELLRLNKHNVAKFQNKDEHYVDAGDEQVAAAVVLAHASQYESLASQLRSIQNVPLSDASSCADVISQFPRIQAAAHRAQQQQNEIAMLRQCSADLVGRWHSLGVLSLNEALAEWEERLMAAEQSIRQGQARRKRGIEAV